MFPALCYAVLRYGWPSSDSCPPTLMPTPAIALRDQGLSGPLAFGAPYCTGRSIGNPLAINREYTTPPP